jgi:predicted SAM-dependent methyltransferase
MKSIFQTSKQQVSNYLTDRIHYACGKNFFEGWLNVDGFDVSYPDGSVDAALAARIYRMDLSQPHPFPDGIFRFGYAEDFLEHLTQAESLIFLTECARTFSPGGVLRLSFPGLAGVLKRHFRGRTRADAEKGVHDAYTRWHHAHFYCADSITLVACGLGFSSVKVCRYGESDIPELHNRETRPDQRDLNLVVELTR